MLSERVNRIGLSPTLRINATAKAMSAQGIDVIDLSVGEPDFPSPINVKEAGKRAIEDDFTKYTPNDGIPELKKAIIEKLRLDNSVQYRPEEILVSPGAKCSLYHVSVALFDEGEDIIIPVPYWVSYPDQVRLAKANPVFVRTREENGFRLTAEDLRSALTFNTKALILNHPCNPTGATYSREDLEEIADVVVREGIIVIADEVYEKLVYDGFRFVSMASLNEKIKKQCLLINGVSKAYSMTGWRIGYAAGPKEIIAAMSKVQSHNTSNATSISQVASLEALRGSQLEIPRMVSEFARRRNYMVHRLRAIPGISCFEPKGAFYLFPNVSYYFDRQFRGARVRNSYGLSYYLLKEARVAVVPGEAFGAEGFIRLSYATSMKNLEEAVKRIINALSMLEAPRKARPLALNNVGTKVRNYVETEVAGGLELRNALVAESEAHLKYHHYFEWNASISGVVIQLRTNSPHLSDFWAENWYPAQLEADIEPHAIIYAVKDVTGRESRAFYNSESHTGFVFNTAFYGQLRSLAIGMLADVSEKTSGIHSVHAAALDVEGSGMLLMAPPRTGKFTHVAGLMKSAGARLVATDFVSLRYLDKEILADAPERKFYIRTDTVEELPQLAALFDKSKLENVVTRRDECSHEFCPDVESCKIDRGEGYCYAASRDSRAMLDPYWMGGTSAHVKRTSVKCLVILCRDSVSPAARRLEPEEALRRLEAADFSAGTGPLRANPFLHPHLLMRSSDRLQLQRFFFSRLLQTVPCFVVNTGAGSVENVSDKIQELLHETVV
ncbi:MAG: aminotransferase class I/II-fold pyridoxal phosphate-dependent enzyme [Candidatus Eiseniibacteriota bacterium]|nr:MAG: aminotransferase class I/II-fold pyridoxal phosphate-dependent enzyme [Candidatus Eisenbacteria bacterium]